jgi:Domain of unknown function.
MYIAKYLPTSLKDHVKRLIGIVTRMISDNTKKKYNLGIVAIAKNEQDYIKEWIAFHKVQGVEKIILYNNDSTDNMVEEIKPFIDDDYVIYHEIHGTKQQLNAYNDALKNYSKLFKYLAFIDCDEFLFPVNDNETVLSVIEKTMKMDRNAGGICVNWVMFGSSGHKTKPNGLLIDNFLWRSKLPGIGARWIKTICNPDLVIRFNHPHYPKYKRGIYNITPKGDRCMKWCNPITEYVGLRINHYFTKSKAQWIERRKFDAMCPNNLRTIDQFYLHDNNDIYDEEILKYKDALCRVIGNYE